MRPSQLYAFQVLLLLCRPKEYFSFSSTVQIPYRFGANHHFTMHCTNHNPLVESKRADDAVHVVHLAKSENIPNIVAVLNEAYRKGEAGIIVDSETHPFQRATIDDIETWVREKKLLVVPSVPQDDGSIVGCIKVVLLEEEGRKIGEWGCLAVDPKFQQQGFGKMLVQAAENFIVDELGCVIAQLELLAPTKWKHEHKEMLRKWYTDGLSYELKVKDDYDKSTEQLPANASLGGRFLLATDADFTTYRKKLR